MVPRIFPSHAWQHRFAASTKMLFSSVARIADALKALMRPCSMPYKCLVSQRASAARQGNGLPVHLPPNSLIFVNKTSLPLRSASDSSPFLIIQPRLGAFHRAITSLTSDQVPLSGSLVPYHKTACPRSTCLRLRIRERGRSTMYAQPRSRAGDVSHRDAHWSIGPQCGRSCERWHAHPSHNFDRHQRADGPYWGSAPGTKYLEFQAGSFTIN